MPWTIDNPPSVAKNWTLAQKQKCVTVANAVLAKGGQNPSPEIEQEAILACIHAAGKSRSKDRTRISKSQVTLYEREQGIVKLVLEDIAKEYLKGQLSLSAFKEKMQSQLKRFYIRVALIAKGKKELTQRDREDLRKFLGLTYNYLDGFVKDLGEYKTIASDQGVISRSSSYGVGWGIFSRFYLPGELADMLPALPGISCLGNGDCGCILEYDSDEEGYNIYWIVSPFKEHCPVCIEYAIEWSPFKISFEEIQEEYGEDIEF